MASMFYDFPHMWNADLMWSSMKTTAQNTHESNFSCQKPKIIHLEWAHLVFHLLTVDDEILHNWHNCAIFGYTREQTISIATLCSIWRALGRICQFLESNDWKTHSWFYFLICYVKPFCHGKVENTMVMVLPREERHYSWSKERIAEL